MNSKNRTSVLINISICSFITSFTGSSINIAIPSIAQDLHINSVLMGWINNSYLLATAVLLLSIGKLGDIIGRKRPYLAGIAIFIIASLACAVSFTGPMLIISRTFQGIGASFLFACSIPILTNAYPPDMRGRVLGTSVASVYFGLSMGPFIGGLITQSFGWHAIFLFITAGMIPVLALSVKILPTDRKPADHAFDIKGSLIYGACILCAIMGLSRITSAYGAALLAAGMTLFVLFLLNELKTPHPLIPIKEFRHNKVFIFSSLAAMINYCATFAIAFFMSLYLQHVLGMTPRHAGIILMVQPIFQALCSPVTGRFSDIHDPKIIASSGMGLTAIILGVFAFYPGVIPVSVIIVLLGLMGISLALFASPNNNAILGSVDGRHLGVASSVLGTMRTVGQVLSMAIAILLLSHYVGSKEITPQSIRYFTDCFSSAFAIFSLLCIIGIGFSLMRGKKRI